MSRLSPTTAQSFIVAGEGQSVEFKDERIKPSDLAETLVAFANTEGGIVLLGVSDLGQIIGIGDRKQATDTIHIAASRECSDPPIVLGSVDQLEMENGHVIVAARVPKARRTVHSAQGRFFRREGSRNVSLSAEDLRQLITSRGSLDDLSSTPKRHGLSSSPSPAYELLRHQVTLSLLDAEGNQAIVERRLKIRFLQDNVIALYDRTWGDGQIFAGYRVVGGRVADRFQSGSRYNTLISLRDTKHRGDTLAYRIRRRITGGFTHQDEWYEVDVDHPTYLLQVTIIFPANRHCIRAELVEASSAKHLPLDAGHFQKRRDGRQVLTWSLRNPLLGERYVIAWQW